MFFLQGFEVQVLFEYNDQSAGWGTGRMLTNEGRAFCGALCRRGDKRFVWLCVELNVVAEYLQKYQRGGLKFPVWIRRESPGIGGK